jgi:hypothetical protein
MTTFKIVGGFAAVLAIGTFASGCSTSATKSPEVSDKIRRDLDEAHYGDVSVSQDRDKGVVTLSGHGIRWRQDAGGIDCQDRRRRTSRGRRDRGCTTGRG